MFKVKFFESSKKLNVLCLGSHPDDIEIGCGGTILRLIDELPDPKFYWVVFSGDEKRHKEACESANAFLKNVQNKEIVVQSFRESYFPFIGAMIKDYFEKLSKDFSPDIIFTHYGGDAHQDHRMISALTWNTFRNHFIVEYEVPKYDADMGTPNLYIQLQKSHVQKKLEYLSNYFQTQKSKLWFDEETFRSIMRIRGLESNSLSAYAEAFYSRKIVF